MTPAQCWAQDLARGLNSSRSSWVHGCGSMCFMGCSSPHWHVVCPSSLNPHFCIRDLHRPVPVRRRFRLDQVGHVSLEPGRSDSLGLNESLCGVVWRWLDQRFSLRVWALPSYRGCRGSFSCLSFSSWDETAQGTKFTSRSLSGLSPANPSTTLHYDLLLLDMYIDPTQKWDKMQWKMMYCTNEAHPRMISYKCYTRVCKQMIP